MKLFNRIAVGALAVLMTFGTVLSTAKAEEENTYTPKEKGEITIRYFDDSKQKVPVVGSKWRLYKVGSITYTNADESVDAMKITPLIEDLELTGETKTEDVFKRIEHKLVSESKITVTGKDDKGKELPYYDAVTDEKGLITFSGLEQGVYFGVEVEAVRNHNRCAEFLISIPYTTEDGNKSNMSAKIEPKAVLGGDIKITKKLEGNNTEATKRWDMELTLPSGTYRYDTNKGQSGFVANKSVVKIVGSESLTVYDLPAGTKFTVVEKDANKDGYRTTYEGQTGTIEYGKTTEATVINYRNKEIKPYTKTDAGQNLIVYGTIGAVSAIAVILILIGSKNKKKQ